MHAELVKNLAGSFESNRVVAARTMRELREKDPGGFTAAALQALKDCANGAGTRYLLSVLLTQPDGLQILFHPEAFSPEQAGELLTQARQLDPQIEVKLARVLAATPAQTEEQTNFATRVLEVLGRRGDPATILPALRQLLQSPNGRVRSKAALLIGRVTRNPQWARLHDTQKDQRVVANAIESLWGLDSEAAKVAFREAADDPRNRVAGNGAVGLYMAGEPRSIQLVFQFSKGRDPLFRATAAWCMGRTRDPRFVQRLQVLTEDVDAMVRQAAFRAQAEIAERISQLAQIGKLTLQIRAPKFSKGEHSMHVLVGDGGAQTRGLTGFHFVAWNGVEVVESFEIEEMHQSQPVHYHISFQAAVSASREVKVELYSPLGVGSETGLELVF